MMLAGTATVAMLIAASIASGHQMPPASSHPSAGITTGIAG
jgi:hypothetical protein